MQGVAAYYELVPVRQVAEEGLEPLDASPSHHNELLQQADQHGAESGAIRQRILIEPKLHCDRTVLRNTPHHRYQTRHYFVDPISNRY